MASSSATSPPGGISPTSPVSPLSQPSSGKTAYFSSSNGKPLEPIIEHIKSGDPISRSPSRVSSRSGSISFTTSRPDSSRSSTKSKTSTVRGPPRAISPPPECRFEDHVSFDNFSKEEPTNMNTVSFTLNVKHKGYKYKRRSRTFMVGIDENAYSNYALQWMLEELVDDGDEIICLRVVDKDSKISTTTSLEKKQYQEEARALMESIQEKNDSNRAISIVLEFAVGKVHTTFQKMIGIYEPAMLIVGTKGRSLGGFQGLITQHNSFSKWCLQYSPIPVVVVRPNEKREKKKAKRSGDPTRQSYKQILLESGKMEHEANSAPRNSNFDVTILPNDGPDAEAHMVAAALGLPAKFDPTLKPYKGDDHRLRKIQSAGSKSDVTDISRDSGSADSRPSSPIQSPIPSPGLKSPMSAGLESPYVSEPEDSDEEGDFEAVDAQSLLENDEEVHKAERLHAMEVDEAAAMKGRKGSVGSVDSTVSVAGSAELEK